MEESEYSNVVEEVEDVICTRSVLVRFPCFDFFRNVHLCEGEVLIKQKDQTHSTSTISSANMDERNGNHDSGNVYCHENTIRENCQGKTKTSTALEFRPDSIEFVPGTLCNEHPILVVNAGMPNEMVFIGNWSEVINESSNTVTNRAIVQIVDKCKSETIVESEENTNTTTNRQKDSHFFSNKTAVNSNNHTNINFCNESDNNADNILSNNKSKEVASLFTHHPGGVTADEERATKRRRLTEQNCCIGSIDVPSAVLVMHRYK